MRRFAETKRIFSPLEIISHHYKSRHLGLFMAVIFTVFLMPYISLQLVGIGAFINAYTDGAITYTTGVGSMMFIIFVYLFLGGMRAVAYTDFVQITASFIGLLAGLFLLFNHFDLSFSSIYQRVNEISPEHLTLKGAKGYYTFPILTSLALITSAIFIQPHILTRALMAKNDRDINLMTIGVIIGYVLAGSIGLTYGLSIYLSYGPDLQPNLVMGYVFKELGNIGLIGLIVSGLMLMGALGAAMSTADSLLIAIGQIATRDMVRPFFRITPTKQVILSKIIMMIILVAAFVTGLKPPQFMTDLAIYSAIGAAIMIPTMLSMTWKRRSTIAAFASIIMGLIGFFIAAGYKVKIGHDLLEGVHTGTLPLVLSFVTFYGVCFLRKLKH